MEMARIRLTENELVNMVRNTINEIYNKQTTLRRLYKVVEPFTHSKYHDTAWQGVSSMINALQDAGYDVSVTVKDGGYRNSKGGNTLFAGDDTVSYWKEFNLEIPIEDKVINGRINAHAAGTVEDPFDSYDLTCTFC